MTRREALLQDIREIERGKSVNPPKEWWASMNDVIRHEYKRKPAKSIERIVGGIWYKYKPATQIKIINEIIHGTLKMQKPRRCLGCLLQIHWGQ